MKRYIVASMKPDILSYNDKEALANELYSIVKKYFYNEGSGSPAPRVSYFEYDIKEYTFRVNSGTYNSRVEMVCNADSSDVNAFKSEVRKLLKSYGFSKVAFDIKSQKRKGDQNTGYYSPTVPVYTYKIFYAIYFAQ